jgi:hypothetical protein
MEIPQSPSFEKIQEGDFEFDALPPPLPEEVITLADLLQTTGAPPLPSPPPPPPPPSEPLPQPTSEHDLTNALPSQNDHSEGLPSIEEQPKIEIGRVDEEIHDGKMQEQKSECEVIHADGVEMDSRESASASSDILSNHIVSESEHESLSIDQTTTSVQLGTE